MLGEMGGDDALAHIFPLLQDKDPSVKAAAFSTIQSIDQSFAVGGRGKEGVKDWRNFTRLRGTALATLFCFRGGSS